jgi:hypothetical protein
MSDITIDLPGKFDGFFSGSSVAQESLEKLTVDAGGYAGSVGLRKVYDAARRITRGKGYSLRLTIPRDENAADIIECLRDYADTCATVNEDNAYGRGLDPQDRNDAYGEMMGGRKVRDLCDKALADLDAK